MKNFLVLLISLKVVWCAATASETSMTPCVVLALTGPWNERGSRTLTGPYSERPSIEIGGELEERCLDGSYLASKDKGQNRNTPVYT